MLNRSAQKQIEAAEALVPELKSRAEEIERLRQLPQDIVQSFVDAELVQMAIAECYGGLESHPLDIMRTIEIISSADASAGWCLMNYQTAAFICGSIAPEWARAVFDGAERLRSVGRACSNWCWTKSRRGYSCFWALDFRLRLPERQLVFGNDRN